MSERPVSSQGIYRPTPCDECPNTLNCSHSRDGRTQAGYECLLVWNDVWEADNAIHAAAFQEDEPGAAIASDLIALRDHLKEER